MASFGCAGLRIGDYLDSAHSEFREMTQGLGDGEPDLPTKKTPTTYCSAENVVRSDEWAAPPPANLPRLTLASIADFLGDARPPGRELLRSRPIDDTLEAPRRPDTTVNASAGWTVVIWQIVVGVTSCVHAYNYRNNSTDYFRAYSLSVNEDICYRVRASLWASPHTFGGACQAPFKASSGPAVNYASKSATFAPAQSAPDNFVCSNHSAWTPDWLQVLNSVGHDAKISG